MAMYFFLPQLALSDFAGVASKEIKSGSYIIKRVSISRLVSSGLINTFNKIVSS